jgi:glycosyl transferase, family 25
MTAQAWLGEIGLLLNGMAIRQINLDARTDRWEECVRNHDAMGFSPHDVTRLSACRDTQFGALGCAKSHMRALCDAYTLDTAEHSMVIEDDFDFSVRKDVLERKLRSIRDSGLKWDVLLLCGTQVLNYGQFPEDLKKVFEAQTTSGYIIKRKYIPTLLACFMDAVEKLENFRNFQPRDMISDRFAIDMAWKTLQRVDGWYIFSPRLGIQRASYSDVEGKVVDYSQRFAE